MEKPQHPILVIGSSSMGERPMRCFRLTGREITHHPHRSNTKITLPVIYDGAAMLDILHHGGTGGQAITRRIDIDAAFSRQFVSFLSYDFTGKARYAFAETVELKAVPIASMRNRAENSRRVLFNEIHPSLAA